MSSKNDARGGTRMETEPQASFRAAASTLQDYKCGGAVEYTVQTSVNTIASYFPTNSPVERMNRAISRERYLEDVDTSMLTKFLHSVYVNDEYVNTLQLDAKKDIYEHVMVISNYIWHVCNPKEMCTAIADRYTQRHGFSLSDLKRPR